MKRKILSLALLFLFSMATKAQSKIDHLIVITTDGFRWQEIFTGMDSSLAVQKEFNQYDSAGLFKKYWRASGEERRQQLLPFFWNTIAKQGQVWGNRKYSNYVNTANKYWFSYPGYNEIFTGYPDTTINSNSLPDNPNTNVLEYLNQQSSFKGKVAAFTAWDAFNHILAEPRSRIPVMAAFDTMNFHSPYQSLFNRMLLNSYKPFGEEECLDVFTHYAAMDYLQRYKPKVLYISYGETDEWAHAGKYRDYLNAVHQVDAWLQEIWTFVQTNPEYKNRTALLITVDHGRGRGNEWTDHGQEVQGANEIWFALVAPGVPAKGELKNNAQVYQQQLAQTMANLLGETFKAKHPIAESLLPVLKR